MNTERIPYQIFGSEDSIDLDIVFFVDELGSTHENLIRAKSLANDFKLSKGIDRKINPNLATLQAGHLTSVYKGTVDELNNALFHTYPLHVQDYPVFIQHPLPRDKALKLLRTLRKTLSFFTKSKHRKEIKLALRNGFAAQIGFLKTVDLTDISLHPHNEKDCWKVMMFSIAQVIALKSGKEIYTKREVIRAFPKLKRTMERQEADIEILRLFLSQLLQLGEGKLAGENFPLFEYDYQL